MSILTENDLMIKPSTMEGSADGLFAKHDIPKYSFLPIIGSYIAKDDIMEFEDCEYVFFTPRGYIHVRDSISGKINEITRGHKTALYNCVLRGNYIVTIHPIVQGDELFVYYGRSYERHGYRAKSFSKKVPSKVRSPPYVHNK